MEQEETTCPARRITFRLTEKEWEKLGRLLEKSTARNLSELIRSALFRGKVTVLAYDNSLDKVMEQLSGIRTELHRIGININQVTHSFHSEKLPEKKLVKTLEILKLYQQTDQNVTELLEIIAKHSEKWLPG